MTPTETRIMTARVALCLDEPFFGVLMMRLKTIHEPSCRTMATDGKSLFYNPAYVDPLSLSQLKGLLAHEVMHNASLHHTRRGHRDPKKWNIACDGAIDHMLKDAGFDVPDSFADNPKCAWMKGLTAEMIYNDERCPDSPKPRAGEICDAPPGEDESEIKIAVQQAAMAHERKKGKGTAWLKQFIDTALTPKVAWQDVLRRFFAPMVPTDRSWARPNRRFVHQGLYLPGTLKSGIGEGIVFADSSGSCIQDWPQFTGELCSIFNDVMPERVHVVMCDTTVKSMQTFERGEEFTPNWEGGGGSDFRPAFAAVEHLKPTWAVVLSDMMIDFPVEAPHYPVIAVSTTDHSGPEWATNIRMDR